jgi:hemolysin III
MPERRPLAPAGRRGGRIQSLGEEIANSVSHGVGFLGAAAALPVLVVDGSRGGAAELVGAAVFAATASLLYLVSTLYHALPQGRAKRALRVLDHCAIFLLIAGSYTPFTLGPLRGPWGFALLGVVWSLALGGVLLKAWRGAAHPRLSLVLYLGTGWLALVAAPALCARLPAQSLFWLLAGGLAYSAGVVFFAAERIRYGHFVWHVFVIGGTACHGVAVLGSA